MSGPTPAPCSFASRSIHVSTVAPSSVLYDSSGTFELFVHASITVENDVVVILTPKNIVCCTCDDSSRTNQVPISRRPNVLQATDLGHVAETAEGGTLLGYPCPAKFIMRRFIILFPTVVSDVFLPPNFRFCSQRSSLSFITGYFLNTGAEGGDGKHKN